MVGLVCDFFFNLQVGRPLFFSLQKLGGMASQMIKNGRKKKYLQTLPTLVGFGSRKIWS